MEKTDIVWSDRKRWLFFGIPWTFTKYSLTENRLLIDSGLLKTVTDEVRLYRITDLSLERSLLQKMFGLGSILVSSYDKTMGDFIIKNIKNPREVKEQLSEMVEEERTRKKVYSREIMADTDDIDGDGHFG